MVQRAGRRRVMTRWAAAGALGALALGVLSACGEQSRVAPDATIAVRGAVHAPDGAPAEDRPVRLGAGITEGEAAFAVLTVGLSCTTGECRGAVRDTTTDARGAYAFTLEGHETQSTFGEAVSILVSATGRIPDGFVSGPLTSARFRVQTEEVTVPDLDLVDAGLTLEGGADAVARWSADRPPPYELTFETTEATPVWRVTTSEAEIGTDSRILEDTAGRAVVAGRFQETIEGGDVELRWRSAARGYAAGAGPPPSRGRPCRYLDERGRHVVASPCELTDGQLTGTATAPPVCDQAAAETAGDTERDCATATVVEVDLGTVVPAELVVVRGCDEGCAVDTTADGVTYRAMGAVSDDFGALPLDGQGVTAVRVGLGAGAGLREVSVWGPRPDRPALRSLDDDTRDAVGAPFDNAAPGDGGGGLPAVTVVLAALAVAAVLAASAFALGRRRT